MSKEGRAARRLAKRRREAGLDGCPHGRPGDIFQTEHNGSGDWRAYIITRVSPAWYDTCCNYRIGRGKTREKAEGDARGQYAEGNWVSA